MGTGRTREGYLDDRKRKHQDDRSTAIKLRKVECYVFRLKQSTVVIFSNLLDFICLKIHHNDPITSNFFV